MKTLRPKVVVDEYRAANAALHRINDTLENELKRIAHALYDESGQKLVAVYLALDRLSRELPAGFDDHVAELRHLLDGVEALLRRLANELRPTILDHLGLPPALRLLADGFSARAGIPVVVEGGDDEFPPAVRTLFYRIVQEALRNVSRHAHATRVTVRLWIEGGRACCSIEDDGRGFETPPAASAPGLGLIGMRERLRALGGMLEIKTGRMQGTVLEITVPLEGQGICPSES